MSSFRFLSLPRFFVHADSSPCCLMVIWAPFYCTFLHVFRIVPKMMQRCVSFQLCWRGIVRNIDGSDVIQIFAPFFRPIMFLLVSMKYFIILEAVKIRRLDSLLVDLFHKLFGKEMMLLPRLGTMPGSSRSLECLASIGNELLKLCEA